MDDLKKKVSYLKGFADGLGLDEATAEGKVLAKMIELMDVMADTIDEIIENQLDNEERLDDMENALTDLEDDFYEMDLEYDGDDMECMEEDEDMDDLFGEDEQEYFEIECPNCHEDVLVDFDMIDEENSIVCPNCHEEIELKIDFDSEEDGEPF